MMKRTVALLLLILVLAGCAFKGTGMNEPLTFYYPRTQPDANTYGDFYSEGIIGSEKREVSGHLDNMNYLLSVYFSGPLDSNLSSPFPMGCRILETALEDGKMTILLNPVLAGKSDLDITVACACLAKTCMELTEAEAVQIESRNLEDKVLFSRTFTKDNLFLRDDYSESPEDTQNTQ